MHEKPQAPAEQVAVALVTPVVQAVPALQVPFAWHDSRLRPEQRVWPGAHEPVQAPEMHVWFVQVAGALHCPTAEHVSTPFDTHCFAPGVHTPEQTPDWHHAGEVQVVPQLPQFELSVCSLTQVAAQPVKPLLHAYPQAPAEQVAVALVTLVVHATGVP